MKLRTSYFNPTAFRKNITRFLPLWGLYTLLLLLVLLLICDSGSYEVPSSIAETVPLFGVANLVYAFLCATVLFGDLFQSRLCNALHAMPLRREGWFLTNVAAGLSFSLAPTLLCAVLGTLALVSSPVDGAWQIPWLVFAAANMQFLFFFGVAVLSMFCAGNRLASLLVYAIVNFFAMLVYWMVDTLYLPMLESVLLQQESFFPFSPVVHICSGEYLTVSYVHDNYYFPIDGSWAFSDGWGYLGICTGLGAVLLGVSLLLYRRRALECAGDFLAEKKLNPVFSAVFTLVMAAVFQSFWELLFGNAAYIFFIAGLVMGFFGAQMLLERTVKVFRPKNFLRFGILAAALIASLLVTKADPLGITRYVPDANQVRAVELEGYTITDPEDIERAIHIHKQIIKTGEESGANVRVSFYYELENGEIVSRNYVVTPQSAAGQLLKTEFFTRPEYVLDYTHWDRYVSGVEEIMIDGNPLEVKDGESYHPEYVRQLLEAIKADCEAGVMTQNWAYYQGEDTKEWHFVDIRYRTERGGLLYCSLRIYPEATNTTKWLNSHKGLWDGAEGFH